MTPHPHSVRLPILAKVAITYAIAVHSVILIFVVAWLLAPGINPQSARTSEEVGTPVGLHLYSDVEVGSGTIRDVEIELCHVSDLSEPSNRWTGLYSWHCHEPITVRDQIGPNAPIAVNFTTFSTESDAQEHIDVLLGYGQVGAWNVSPMSNGEWILLYGEAPLSTDYGGSPQDIELSAQALQPITQFGLRVERAHY